MNDVIHNGYDSWPVITHTPDLFCTFSWRIRLLQAALAHTDFAPLALELRLSSITYAELLDLWSSGALGRENEKYVLALKDQLIIRTRELELVAGLVQKKDQKCSSLLAS